MRAIFWLPDRAAFARQAAGVRGVMEAEYLIPDRSRNIGPAAEKATAHARFSPTGPSSCGRAVFAAARVRGRFELLD